jgi:hypothetical protein
VSEGLKSDELVLLCEVALDAVEAAVESGAQQLVGRVKASVRRVLITAQEFAEKAYQESKAAKMAERHTRMSAGSIFSDVARQKTKSHFLKMAKEGKQNIAKREATEAKLAEEKEAKLAEGKGAGGVALNAEERGRVKGEKRQRKMVHGMSISKQDEAEIADMLQGGARSPLAMSSVKGRDADEDNRPVPAEPACLPTYSLTASEMRHAMSAGTEIARHLSNLGIELSPLPPVVDSVLSSAAVGAKSVLSPLSQSQFGCGSSLSPQEGRNALSNTSPMTALDWTPPPPPVPAPSLLFANSPLLQLLPAQQVGARFRQAMWCRLDCAMSHPSAERAVYLAIQLAVQSLHQPSGWDPIHTAGGGVDSSVQNLPSSMPKLQSSLPEKKKSMNPHSPLLKPHASLLKSQFSLSTSQSSPSAVSAVTLSPSQEAAKNVTTATVAAAAAAAASAYGVNSAENPRWACGPPRDRKLLARLVKAVETAGAEATASAASEDAAAVLAAHHGKAPKAKPMAAVAYEHYHSPNTGIYFVVAVRQQRPKPTRAQETKSAAGKSAAENKVRLVGDVFVLQGPIDNVLRGSIDNNSAGSAGAATRLLSALGQVDAATAVGALREGHFATDALLVAREEQRREDEAVARAESQRAAEAAERVTMGAEGEEGYVRRARYQAKVRQLAADALDVAEDASCEALAIAGVALDAANGLYSHVANLAIERVRVQAKTQGHIAAEAWEKVKREEAAISKVAAEAAVAAAAVGVSAAEAAAEAAATAAIKRAVRLAAAVAVVAREKAAASADIAHTFAVAVAARQNARDGAVSASAAGSSLAVRLAAVAVKAADRASSRRGDALEKAVEAAGLAAMEAEQQAEAAEDAAAQAANRLSDALGHLVIVATHAAAEAMQLYVAADVAIQNSIAQAEAAANRRTSNLNNFMDTSRTSSRTTNIENRDSSRLSSRIASGDLKRSNTARENRSSPRSSRIVSGETKKTLSRSLSRMGSFGMRSRIASSERKESRAGSALGTSRGSINNSPRGSPRGSRLAGDGSRVASGEFRGSRSSSRLVSTETKKALSRSLSRIGSFRALTGASRSNSPANSPRRKSPQSPIARLQLED